MFTLNLSFHFMETYKNYVKHFIYISSVVVCIFIVAVGSVQRLHRYKSKNSGPTSICWQELEAALIAQPTDGVSDEGAPETPERTRTLYDYTRLVYYYFYKQGEYMLSLGLLMVCR